MLITAPRVGAEPEQLPLSEESLWVGGSGSCQGKVQVRSCCLLWGCWWCVCWDLLQPGQPLFLPSVWPACIGRLGGNNSLLVISPCSFLEMGQLNECYVPIRLFCFISWDHLRLVIDKWVQDCFCGSLLLYYSKCSFVCNFFFFGSVMDDSDLLLLRRHLLLPFPHRWRRLALFSASDVMLSCKQLWAGLQSRYFSV